ncbi:MAG: calcium-binding protein [Thermoguttaceae bacterium]
MNPLAAIADVPRHGLTVVAESRPEHDRRERILEALWPLGEHLPGVNEETLSRYYKYLTVRLSLPFTATYPEPRTALEEAEYRCTAVELLDPAKDIGDDFDGIFCKARKGKYEINLPLVELEIPPDSPNFQLIDDYGYWFWNWR